MTAILARFLAESRWEEVPEAIRHEARRAILNWLGCVLGGLSDPAVRLLSRIFPADRLNTALVNAAAANVLDFDDTHLRTVIHPSAPVAAALFALAQHRMVSGRDLLHAFVLGVEAACRVGNAVSPGHYEKGWHITGTCGVFGAAAAAGRILSLTPSQMTFALGIAATQSAGLVEMLGSMARVLNPGFAARNGLAAALLAAQGFEGPAQPLEGRRGFVNVFGGNHALPLIEHGLGKHWALAEVAFKAYPCGVVLHSLIDACLQLRKDHLPEGVKEILITLHPLAIERGDRPEPRSGVEARLSAQHAAAAALVHGAAGVEQFTDAAVQEPAVKQLRGKVKLQADPALGKAAARVRVAPENHPPLESEVSHARGSVERPLSDAELEDKFRGLAEERAEDWIRLVRTLESLDDAGRIARAIGS